MEPVNAHYYETMKRWWQFTETRMDFYDTKLKEHQDHVFKMREYHTRKDAEEQRIYIYWKGKVEIVNNARGTKVDVYA